MCNSSCVCLCHLLEEAGREELDKVRAVGQGFPLEWIQKGDLNPCCKATRGDIF